MAKSSLSSSSGRVGKSAYLLLFLLVLSGLQHSSSKSFFAQCDANSDTQLSELEFQQCFLDLGKSNDGFGRAESVVKSDLKTLFGVLDRNKDGVVSSAEYGALQKMMSQHRGFNRPPLERQEALRDIDVGDDEDEDEDEDGHEEGSSSSTSKKVKFKRRDGTIETMDKDALYDKMNEQMKGFRRTPSDQLIREVEAKSNMTHILENEPALRKIITLGEWSLAFLYHHRLLSISEEDILAFEAANKQEENKDQKPKLPVKLAGLSTIPFNTETGQRVSDSDLSTDAVDYQKIIIDLSNKDKFEVGLLMKVKLPLNKVEEYEVKIEYNKSKYPVKPHIIMTDAVRLNRDANTNAVSVTKLELPEPPKPAMFKLETVEAREIPSEKSEETSTPSIPDGHVQNAEKTKVKKKKVYYYLSIAGGKYRIPLQAIGYVFTMLIFFFVGFGYMILRAPKSKHE